MPSYFPAQEIVPGLWIGSEGDSGDASFFAEHDIGFVVNCTRNIPFLKQPGVETYRISVNDDPKENAMLYSHLRVIVAEIDAALSRGKGVLVHCRAGMQRSAATVAAYLMYKYKLTADQAMDAIKERKPETFFPVATFEKALRKYQKTLEQQRLNNANNNTSSLNSSSTTLAYMPF